MVITTNIDWFDAMLVVDYENQKDKKDIAARSTFLTGCMGCKTLKLADNDVYCEHCKEWYHDQCGLQKKANQFICPVCDLSMKVKYPK